MTADRGELCAVLLAAGEGTRLRPLTGLRPKALCPVGNVPLLDRALARVAGLGLAGAGAVAVNACWLGEQVAAHVGGGTGDGGSDGGSGGGRAYVSMEQPPPLGTAGGVARLREWIDGRAVLVGNTDAYLAGDPTGAEGGLDRLVAGWDGGTVRLLGVPAPAGEVGTFAGCRFAGFSLLPWRWVRDLPAGPGELVGAVWRPAEAAGALQVVRFDGFFRDTGTPADYLAANRHAAAAAGAPGGNLVAPGARVSGGCRGSVVGAGAVVRGALTRAVVWPGGYVGPNEHLVDAVRAGHDLTVRCCACCADQGRIGVI